MVLSMIMFMVVMRCVLCDVNVLCSGLVVFLVVRNLGVLLILVWM